MAQRTAPVKTAMNGWARRQSETLESGKTLWEQPVIRKDDCKRCHMCVDVCPDSAVHAVPVEGQDKPDYVIDYEFCKGCGLCVYECPAKAIDLIPEEK